MATRHDHAALFKPGRVKTGGRVKGVPPKTTTEFKKMCAQYTGECVAYMVEQLRQRTEHAFGAAEFLMNHGHGKPSQQVALSNPDGTALDFTGMNNDELAIAILRISAFLDGTTSEARPDGVAEGAGAPPLH